MKVSVIIPTYKPGKYIEQCLKSLYSQTLSHNEFEVIIVLNGDKEPFFSKINEFIVDNNNGVKTI